MRQRRTPTTTRRGLCFHLWRNDYTSLQSIEKAEASEFRFACPDEGSFRPPTRR